MLLDADFQEKWLPILTLAWFENGLVSVEKSKVLFALTL